jgi:hypothetical protein
MPEFLCHVTSAIAPAGKLWMVFKKWASAYQLQKLANNMGDNEFL